MGRLAEVGPVRHLIGPTGQIPLEDAADRVGAVPGEVGDLEDRVAAFAATVMVLAIREQPVARRPVPPVAVPSPTVS